MLSILNSEKGQATSWKVRLALSYIFQSTATRLENYLCTSLAIQVSILHAASDFLVCTVRFCHALLMCAYMPGSFMLGAHSFNMLGDLLPRAHARKGKAIGFGPSVVPSPDLKF